MFHLGIQYSLEVNISFMWINTSEWMMALSSKPWAVKKHKCKYCEYKTADKDNLKRHSQAKHEGKTFQC